MTEKHSKTLCYCLNCFCLILFWQTFFSVVNELLCLSKSLTVKDIIHLQHHDKPLSCFPASVWTSFHQRSSTSFSADPVSPELSLHKTNSNCNTNQLRFLINVMRRWTYASAKSQNKQNWKHISVVSPTTLSCSNLDVINVLMVWNSKQQMKQIML